MNIPLGDQQRKAEEIAKMILELVDDRDKYTRSNLQAVIDTIAMLAIHEGMRLQIKEMLTNLETKNE